jgi:ABC-type ATPase with predicted acetyltransferase domain
MKKGEVMEVEIRSERARRVAGMFGVKEGTKFAIENCQLSIANCVELRAGTVTLVTGASGGGKSMLLRELRAMHGDRAWVDVGQIELADVPVVDCFESDELVEVLMMLGRVGLGEVWTYLRTPAELSEGQRWRLRLALGLWRLRGKRGVLVADEFCAVLDRITAKVVSRCLRKTIDGEQGVAAVVASSHDDLQVALRPEVVVRCDFGKASVAS